MPQFKILLDTNVYLRLAQSMHPLLFKSFGTKQFTLYLINGFQAEFDRSARLKSTFFWVNDPEYRLNRKYELKISNRQKKDVELSHSFLWEQNLSEDLGASKIDVEALAYAMVLNIPIVTDDFAMANLGKTYGIEVWSILDLLELMYKNNHVSIDDINLIIGFLFHNNDLPFPAFIEELTERFKNFGIEDKFKTY